MGVCQRGLYVDREDKSFEGPSTRTAVVAGLFTCKYNCFRSRPRCFLSERGERKPVKKTKDGKGEKNMRSRLA